MYKTMVNVEVQLEHAMLSAAEEVSFETEKHTHHYTPEEEHYLVGGFKMRMRSYPPLLQMDMIYSAKANDGFDYAAFQHEAPLNHFGPEKKFIKPGATMKYMMIGYGEVPVEAIIAKHSNRVL
jgi:hypothetical protein